MIMKAIRRSSCFLLCVAAGCGASATSPLRSPELAKELDALKSRVEALENRRPRVSTQDGLSDIQIDSERSTRVFADATHVSPAGRYVLIYFGTRSHQAGSSAKSETQLKVYMNYYTAKRMQAALAMSLQRHIAVFGDVAANAASTQPATDEGGTASYSNFVRLTGSPEELLIELGLNPQPIGVPAESIPVDYTVILDYHTTDTLLRQINSTIRSYEAEHGPIETDIEKRVVN